ncbi:MAG TPA: tripartite tricarboxylate transporter substrate-binding protein [Xanthobacteraceae bacterium]|nr:tripartite tricarboxylate transporter substrate-binding protein [Xanthobacteraceae bacterium]
MTANNKWNSTVAKLSLAGLIFFGWFGVGHAQDSAAFYKGRTVDLYVGYSVGAGYDLYARLVGRHLGKHIPGNPTVVVKNMEGAGSLRLVNWLYSAAPKDGTALGTFSRGAPFDPILGRQGAKFDPVTFGWIGSANNEVSVCVATRESKVTSFDYLKQRELIVGAAGVTSDDNTFPLVLNKMFGTKMKVITAYPGGNEIALAMERGEVAGRCGWSWSSLLSTYANWIKEKKINLLAQFGLSKHADLPSVPLVTELARNDEERQALRLVFARQPLGRPFSAPPGLPPERLNALRNAFDATMKDKDFLAEADKARIEINPMSGGEIEQLMRQIYAETPTNVAKLVAEMVK